LKTKFSATKANLIYWVIRLLNLFISLFTDVLNDKLETVIKKQSIKEKHQTYSDYATTVALKTSIAMFCNTGIIPILVNM